MMVRFHIFIGVLELLCLALCETDEELVLQSSPSSSVRTKRVLGGTSLLTRTSGYNAVRYFVWISDGWECSFIAPEWMAWFFNKYKGARFSYNVIGFRCNPDFANLLCGGALITPKIVQTACHCLAYFAWSSKAEEPHRAILETRTEAQLKVYLGINRVEDFTIGMPSLKHFVHQKCSEHSKIRDLIVWDYGWIVLPFPVDNWGDYPRHLINYAPQYTRSELINVWDRTLKNQPACLLLGFGGYAVHQVDVAVEGKPKKTKSVEIISNLLRHEWFHQVSWMECKNLTDWFDPQYKLKYREDATWGCGVPFTRAAASIGRGDSGGPVSCDNQYVGLAHTGKPTVRKTFGKPVRITTFCAIRFALLENALEYRKKFMEHIGHYKEFTDGNQNQPYIPLFPPLRKATFKMNAEIFSSSGAFISSMTRISLIIVYPLLVTLGMASF